MSNDPFVRKASPHPDAAPLLRNTLPHRSSIHTATAASIAPKARFIRRALLSLRNRRSSRSPARVQRVKARRLFSVKTAVIQNTSAGSGLSASGGPYGGS